MAKSPVDTALASLEYVEWLLAQERYGEAKEVTLAAATCVNPIFGKSRVAGASMASLVNVALEGRELAIEKVKRCVADLQRLRQKRRNRRKRPSF